MIYRVKSNLFDEIWEGGLDELLESNPPLEETRDALAALAPGEHLDYLLSGGRCTISCHEESNADVWSTEAEQARQNARDAFALAKTSARRAARCRSTSILSTRRRTDELDEAALQLDRALNFRAEAIRFAGTVATKPAPRRAFDCDNCNDRRSLIDGSGERVSCWACR